MHRIRNSGSAAVDVNIMLRQLDGVSKMKVFEKEIKFKNARDREDYCTRFKKDPKDFGLSPDMFKCLNRIDGTVFLCSNRDARANTFTYNYKNSSALEKKEIELRNKDHTLDWHATVLIYHKRTVYYFDSALDPKALPDVASDFHFKSKLTDFINGAKKKAISIPIDKMFVTGLGNTVNDQCRPLAIDFIKDVVISISEEKACGKYMFKEFVRGPSKPMRKLEIRHSINLNN